MLFDQRRVGAEAAEVGAGAEDLLAGPGEHHRAHLVVVARRFIASTSSVSIWPESMLRFSGSLSVTVATPSATS